MHDPGYFGFSSLLDVEAAHRAAALNEGQTTRLLAWPGLPFLVRLVHIFRPV